MIGGILLAFVEDIIRWISGPVGIRLRRGYYRRRFKACGRGLTISPGVIFQGAGHISVGDNVWIDAHAVLIAGPLAADAVISTVSDADPSVTAGEITIGDNAHVGIGTIIQGHGGVRIGDAFTSSPGVKIYSLSNDYRTNRAGTVRSAAGAPAYVCSPVSIGDNVWLGLDCLVIGHSIGSDCFIRPRSVVSRSIPANSLCAGDPALPIGTRFSR